MMTGRWIKQGVALALRQLGCRRDGGAEFALRGWQQSGTTVVLSYRVVSVLLADAHILFGHVIYSPLPPVALAVFTNIYTAIFVAGALWKGRGLFSYGILACDAIVASLLLISTGGLFSPFLLYSLVPLLTSALFLNRRTTGVVAMSSVGCAVGGYFLRQVLGPLNGVLVGYFFAYCATVCLSAILPYVINTYVRKQMLYEDTLRERQRLSHEIHDGVVQTVSALRWQVQILRRRLADLGIDLSEARDLETLAEKARYESREALELLRSYTGDGSLLPHLREYVDHLNQENHVRFELHAPREGLLLDPIVELELLRICQEALTNARLHAQADKVDVTVEKTDGLVTVKIADNGRGFDAVAFYNGAGNFESHGLKIMHERARSIGGHCWVISLPGRGTDVLAEVPADQRHVVKSNRDRSQEVHR